MVIYFQDKDPKVILDSINQAMGDRALKKIVSFELDDSTLFVDIKKMGTSRLTFEMEENTSGITCTLQKEKIALAHRAFKDEVTEKILKIIQKAGGKVDA